MEFTNKKQTERLKEIGVDVMTSDIYVSKDDKTIFGQLGNFCPRCNGEMIWMSDFMRSEIEDDDNVELGDDTLVTYYKCKDCNCTVEVVDAWPSEEGDGALFRIAWTGDALVKLITDLGIDFMMTKIKNNKGGEWKMDVFAFDNCGGFFTKQGDNRLDVLYKAVVEIYENKQKNSIKESNNE